MLSQPCVRFANALTLNKNHDSLGPDKAWWARLTITNRTWLTTVLVQHDEVRDIIGPACANEVLDDVVATVQPLRVREQELHLLCVDNKTTVRYVPSMR